MASEELKDFRLVGGIALSLKLGHRMSIDIDLFSEADYGSIDFKRLDNFLNSTFIFVDHFSYIELALGKSYLIGTDKDHAVKLDIYYTDRLKKLNISQSYFLSVIFFFEIRIILYMLCIHLNILFIIVDHDLKRHLYIHT